MSDEGSVTRWIQKLAEGDHSVAEEELFHRYFEKLVFLASEKLGSTPQAAEDEEDVARAMDSFFQRVRQGRFPDLANRTELWALLVTITSRKAINQKERQFAVKRGGRLHAHSLFLKLIGDEPSPDLVVELAEECNRRLESLADGTLQLVARLKLEGYTNAEIADKLDIAQRTVGRKLNRIRREWSEGLA